ncbi:MAG: NotI family restriction endonuclease [Terriglobia bacterium]
MLAKATSKVKPPIREVAEVFGFPSRSDRKAARDHRAHHQCPFLKSLCIKTSQHRALPSGWPFGACSVWHSSAAMRRLEPHIICPVRFLQDNRIFKDTATLLKRSSPSSRILLFHEIGFKGIGKLDYILVESDKARRKFSNMLLLEAMAVSTTGTGHVIRSFLDALSSKAPKPPYKYGINFRQVVSRMMVQALAKAHTARHWGFSSAWAIQDVLYEFMRSISELNLTKVNIKTLAANAYPLYFFVYRLDTTGPVYKLKLRDTLAGSLLQVAKVFEPKKLPPKSRLLKQLHRQVESGQAIDFARMTVPPRPGHKIVE